MTPDTDSVVGKFDTNEIFKFYESEGDEAHREYDTNIVWKDDIFSIELPPFTHYPMWDQTVTLYKGTGTSTRASSSGTSHSQSYKHSPQTMLEYECFDISDEDLYAFEYQVWSFKLEFTNLMHATGL